MNLATKRTDERQSMGTAKSSCASISVRHFVYFIGGNRQNNDNNDLNLVERYIQYHFKIRCAENTFS